MSAVEVGDHFETSETLSIDDGGTSAADDDIEPQIQEAFAALDRGFATGSAILKPLIILFGYVLPAFFILRDRRVKLEERGLWLLATFAVSWLAFLVFLWIAPLLGTPTKNRGEESTAFETAKAKYEGEESTAFKTSRVLLTGGISIGAAISFGVGALLVMISLRIMNAGPAFQAFSFLAVFPFFGGMAMMIPGVVLAFAMAAKVFFTEGEFIDGQ